MKIHAVVNRRAGTAMEHTPERIEAILAETFSGRGHDIHVDCVGPDAVEEAMKAAFDAGPDAVLVGGGDGTIRTAATLAIETGGTLAILPLGTLNRLARDLGIPLDPEAAAEALADGTVRRIDAAEVNGRIFLCNSVLGLPPEFNERRQLLRGRPLGERIRGYASIVATMFRSRHRLAVALDDGGHERKAMRVLSLAVTNNPYGETPSLLFTRPALDTGRLGLYIAKHRTAAGMFWLLFQAVLGRWPRDPRFTWKTAERVTISARKGKLKVTTDGEIERLEPPLEYAIRPRALSLLVPRGTDGAGPADTNDRFG